MRYQNVFIFDFETTRETAAATNLTCFDDANINSHSRAIADMTLK